MNCLKLIGFFLLSVSNLSAQYSENELTKLLQKSSEQELVIESSRLMEHGLFYDAEQIVDKLLKSKPESCNYNYRKGYLILAGGGDFIRATPYLEKAVHKVNKHFDIYSVNEPCASIDAIYHLATCYHMSGQLDDAVKLYNQYISYSEKKAVLMEQSHLKIKQCAVARELMDTPNPNVSVKNAGTSINSALPEYSAVISLDGSSLFFTSRRPWEDGASDAYIDGRNNLHPEDIYVSYLDEAENWSAPARLDFCTKNNNEATVSVNSDERRVYMYKDETGDGDIYYSDFSEHKFKEALMFDPKDLNTKYWEPHCTISPDGSTMYFVSSRPGGYGGRDIYRMTRKSDGKWGEPKNLGPEINTAYDEDSPFISVDGKNLYFSSNGPKSMGGFDIFISILDNSDNWSTPKNLGYPINSCGEDLYYTTTIDGYKGYFTSFRKGGMGEKDIYEVSNNYMGVSDIAFLKERFFTVDNKKMPEDVGITLKCMDCKDSKDITVYPRLRDGLVISKLEPCKTYEIIYHHAAATKEFFRETIQTECNKHYHEIYKEVLLDVDQMKIVPRKAPEPETVIALSEVPVSGFKNLEFAYLFDYDDNKLSVKGRHFRKFMREIERQLSDGREKVTIQVFSSASKVPTKKYGSNENLAMLRAENVKYDLITHFQSSKKFKDRVNVVIVNYTVEGPEYENDNSKRTKYKPYQSVILKTE